MTSEQKLRKPPHHYRRDNCRLCQSKDLELLFSLEPTPPAEWYFRGEDRKATSISFPLDLFMCKSCSHVQLLDVLDPNSLFSDYFYESVTSPGLAQHFRKYASVVSTRVSIMPGDLVVDIGSNDGLLLKEFRDLGYQVIGIEPSKILAQKCNSAGIRTYNTFLNETVVEQVMVDSGQASLITANNVFAHNDDLRGMARCISRLLKDGGTFIFEVSSLLHTMKGLVFDYVYHEHLSYHSLMSLEPFLKEFSLQIYDVEVVETKGGSYRVYSKKDLFPLPKSPRLLSAIREEISSEINTFAFYRDIYKEITDRKNQLHLYLKQLPDEAKVVGYGASATSTTLLYEFSLQGKLSYLVDDNPIRQGCFLPGSNLEVFSPEYMFDDGPTHVLLIAWRFKDMIINKIKNHMPKDCVFIVPLPNFAIINREELHH
jgi:SAM-dependent methyltransferase